MYYKTEFEIDKMNQNTDNLITVLIPVRELTTVESLNRNNRDFYNWKKELNRSFIEIDGFNIKMSFFKEIELVKMQYKLWIKERKQVLK